VSTLSSCRGKSGVVTGASGGLGRATVLALAADGANVLGLSRNADALQETVGLAEQFDGSVIAMPADACDEQAVARALRSVEEHFAVVDFVVNNAGSQIEKGLLDTTNDDWDVVDRTNVRAPFWFCKYAAEAMLRLGRGGSIVNIASTLSVAADPMLTADTTCKHAVLGLTRVVAVTREFARAGIRCYAVLPGDMDTPMAQKYFAAHDDSAAARATISAAYPTERIADPALDESRQRQGVDQLRDTGGDVLAFGTAWSATRRGSAEAEQVVGARLVEEQYARQGLQDLTRGVVVATLLQT
jgi:NAD(P)-dependent dehydrogenase (short-subunit alcohol dehydrogenase family)